jgi:uncharacterized protein (TIGR02466 family)
MVKKVFESSIYVKSLYPKANKSWNKEYLKEIEQIKQVDEEGQTWSQKYYWGGYTSYSSASQSFDKLHRFSSTFEKLEKKIRPHVKKFAQNLYWDVNLEDLRISTFWVNVMPQGTTHSFHHHPLSVISGTFYIQVPKNSSGIQFEDPRFGLMMACPPRKSKAPDGIRPHLLVKPEPGELILFESWMKHQVPPNPSEKDRISVSFNYDWVKTS